jgi:hypothetical protein
MKARLAFASLLVAGLAACSGSTSLILPADPAFDGHTLGSGGRTDPPPPPAEGGETTAEDGAGHTLGSGG